MVVGKGVKKDQGTFTEACKLLTQVVKGSVTLNIAGREYRRREHGGRLL